MKVTRGGGAGDKEVALPPSAPHQPPDQDMRQALTAMPRPHFNLLADPQEELFARHLTLYPPLQAYKASGYPLHHSPAATQAAAMLLSAQPNIQERASYFMELHAHRLDIRVERLLAEQGALAFSDIGECFDPTTGNMLPINQIPQHTRTAIKSVRGKITEIDKLDANGNTIATKRTQDIQIQFYDKTRALDTLHKLTGLVDNPAHEQMGPKVVFDATGKPEGELV